MDNRGYFFMKSFLFSLKRPVQHILLLLGSIVVFLLGVEGIFRLLGIACVEPYSDRDWYNQYVQLNSRGFRDYEHTEEKPPGTFRILGIGDSYTFGVRVNFEDIYLTRLERMLNERYPSRHYEVINMGVPGYGTMEELRLLRKKGLLYQPDLVIVGYVLNDAEHPLLEHLYKKKVRALVAAEPDYSKKLKEISQFYRYVYFLYFWGIKARDLDRDGYLASLYSAETNPYLHDVKKALAQMIQLVKQQNGQVLVVLFPIFSPDPREEERFAQARRIVQTTCQHQGAYFLDMYPLFRDALKSGKAKRYWATPFDAHPNKEAHAIIAEQIFKVIAEEKLITGDGQWAVDNEP